MQMTASDALDIGQETRDTQQRYGIGNDTTDNYARRCQMARRLVERGSLVEGTAQLEPDTGGRPAELFRFRREVRHERPAPGVGLPGLPGGH